MAGIESSGKKDLAAFLGSELLRESTCRPCGCEGRQLEAVGFCATCQEPLCDECFQYHTRPTPTKHHVLIHRASSLKKSRLTSLKKRVFSFKNKIPDKCSEHLEKSIKYFCQTHDHLGCSVCMTLSHRNCEGLQYILDVSKEVATSDELHDVEIKLKAVVDKSNEIIQNIQGRSSQAESINSNALQAVEKYKKEIIEVLNELEKKIKGRLEEIKEEEMHELNGASMKCTETIKEAHLLSQQLVQMKHNNCSLYIALKRTNSRLRLLEEEIQTAQLEAQHAKTAVHYTFKPTTEILEQMRRFETFGELVSQNNTVTCMEDVNVRSESDQSSCWLSGIAVLPNNQLAVADRNNRKVKVVDTVENSIVSDIQLESRPWDISTVSDTQVVVSHPNKKRLMFINTEPELKIDHELTLEEPCYGVTYSQDSLYVTFAGEHKVKVLDMKGKVLKVFSSHEAEQRLFFTPCYVSLSANKQLIYITNSGNDSLVAVTPDGEYVASFKDSNEKFLRQSIVDQQGMVYVCVATGNIHQLTADCRKVKTLLTGLEDKTGDKILPFSINYDCMTDQLYVGMENKDVVKVFKINFSTL